MSKRVIIAGGGTGGHIFPAIAIANALKVQCPMLEILFVGAKGKMEMQKIPQAGFHIEGLDIAGFNRSSLIKNIGLPFKLLKSFLQVRSILRRFKPDAVIGVGGYSSFPVLRMAQFRGIKTFLHESNSFAGKTNQLLGKKADKVFVAFEGMEIFFPKTRLMVTGNPVRSSIVHAEISRAEAIQSFGLDPARTTILSVGGSLGAKSINEAISEGLPVFGANNMQVIWQTGEAFFQRGRSIAAGKEFVWVGDFIMQMERAYSAADLVISRAGAMAIAEIAVVGKPSVLVPYPYAAEDHQTVNAKYLVEKSAAVLVNDSAVKEELVAAVVRLAVDSSKQQQMKSKLGDLAVTNAAEIIAEEVLKNLK